MEKFPAVIEIEATRIVQRRYSTDFGDIDCFTMPTNRHVTH